jgi:hypothetical protein
VARDLNADDLPDDIVGLGSEPEPPDQQEFNDAFTAGHGSQNGEPEIRAVLAQEERDTNLELLDALRAMQGAESIKWKIFRINADEPRRNGYLEEVSTARLNMDYLRDTYGPGTYRIRGHHMTGGKYAGQRTIIVAEGAKSKMHASEDSQGPSAGFDFMAWVEQQDARDRMRRQEQEERDERRRKERMDLIATLGPIVAPIIAAMVQNRGPDLTTLLAAMKPDPGPNMLDVVQTLKAMKELDGPAQIPQEDSVDKIFRVVDMLKESGFGAGEGKTDLWDLAKELIKQVGPGLGQVAGAIAQAVQARQSAAVPALPAGASAPAMPALSGPGTSAVPAMPAQPTTVLRPVTPPPSTGAANPSPSIDPKKAEAMGLFDLLPLAPHLPWLKGHIERNLVYAARGSNPQLYAEVMADDFPSVVDPRVLGGVLARPDWFNLLKSLDIRVAQFEEWFTVFRDELLKLIQEDTGVSFGIRSDAGQTDAGTPIIEVQGPEAARDEADGA